MTTKKETKTQAIENNQPPALPKCGIVMPISAIDGCEESHWREVLSIIQDAAAQAGFDGKLVSHLNESGNIQKKIIQNLYQNEIVVCDISGKNPNVMLELGIRLAFDKPTIVVKDYSTDFSFDISPMAHVQYRRDLRFQSIIDFKEELTEKISATYKAAQEDSDYTSFIRSFGEFKIVKIDEKAVSENEYIIDQLRLITSEISSLKSDNTMSNFRNVLLKNRNAAAAAANPLSRHELIKIQFTTAKVAKENLATLLGYIQSTTGVQSVGYGDVGSHGSFIVHLEPDASVQNIKENLELFVKVFGFAYL